MKAKLGRILLTIGAILLACALGLVSYNIYIQNKAEKASQSIIPKLAEKINENIDSETTDVAFADTLKEEEEKREMDTVEIDGNNYIGVLSIPSLSLELPVMADWSNEKLNISPCLYSGSLYSDDMVVMAHNYTRHFAPISQLNENDIVRFTDVTGKVTDYRVVLTDCLSAVAVEEMTAGEFDLTLFTCNYDGKSRITVRCDKK